MRPGAGVSRVVRVLRRVGTAHQNVVFFYQLVQDHTRRHLTGGRQV
ncbi:MAG: hypothetical protein GDA56_12540 [Hormoscilla sp. GM7CHS1pb]|nr:hypothetical protein [Hormoscilla sp. GM7CHS1pb]